MSRSITNNGTGALYGTFKIKAVRHKSGSVTYLFSAEDVGIAVALIGNNEIGPIKDLKLYQLLGRLEHVQDDIATVQIGGVVRLPYDSITPELGDGVLANSNGKVHTASQGRGMVLAVDTKSKHCDILI